MASRSVGRVLSVGTPGAEAMLTTAAARSAKDLLSPGAGRSLFLLTEVEIGIGRPDLLLLTASSRAVLARAAHGLRLQNWVEARVLGSWLTGNEMTGVSREHAASVAKRLQGRGWTLARAERGVPLVADSLLIEAKVSSWKSGLAQLARTRRMAQRSALLLPQTANRLVERQRLERGSVGLLVFDPGSGIRWQKKAPSRAISPAARLWLGELAIRALENRRVQTLSSVRNASRARRKVSRRWP
jgi:hypothetical protein